MGSQKSWTRLNSNICKTRKETCSYSRMTPVSRMGKGGAQKKERKNKRGVLGGVKALKATTKVCFVSKGQPPLVWVGVWLKKVNKKRGDFIGRILLVKYFSAQIINFFNFFSFFLRFSGIFYKNCIFLSEKTAFRTTK